MRQPMLPVPDGVGVYSFPDDLQEAHRGWGDWLMSRRLAGDNTIIDVVAPYGAAPYLVEQRRPCGRPVLALEPHYDDLVLSASGLFLGMPRPLAAVTVFTRSASVHSDLRAAYPTVDKVSELRAEEARQSLRPLRATQISLGYTDAEAPYRPHDPALADQLVDQLRAILHDHPDHELLAPAGVTRHPDHLLVHEVACRLGSRWFWDDVAFWPTYALGACDRQLFRMRVGTSLTPELVDISGVLLDKLTLLRTHASQIQPLREMYRPLRYAWTVASELPWRRSRPNSARFAERYFRIEPT